MATDWTRDPEWDVVFIGGARMPGVARVGINMPGCLDVAKPKGGRGAIVRDTGLDVARINITLTLLPEDLEEYERVLDIIRPRQLTEAAKEFDFDHPLTGLHGIHRIKVNDVKTSTPSAGGWLMVEIMAIESFDRPKAVKQPARHEEGNWKNVDGLIDAISELPVASGAVDENFTSADQPLGSGFE